MADDLTDRMQRMHMATQGLTHTLVGQDAIAAAQLAERDDRIKRLTVHHAALASQVAALQADLDRARERESAACNLAEVAMGDAARVAAERDALVHDIDGYVKAASEQAADILRLEAERDALRALIQRAVAAYPANDMTVPTVVRMLREGLAPASQPAPLPPDLPMPAGWSQGPWLMLADLAPEDVVVRQGECYQTAWLWGGSVTYGHRLELDLDVPADKDLTAGYFRGPRGLGKTVAVRLLRPEEPAR